VRPSRFSGTIKESNCIGIYGPQLTAQFPLNAIVPVDVTPLVFPSMIANGKRKSPIGLSVPSVSLVVVPNVCLPAHVVSRSRPIGVMWNVYGTRSLEEHLQHLEQQAAA
jgi:hypothetical protein